MYLEGPGLLGLPNGLDKSGSGKRLHAPIPQTSGGATIPKQLERVVGYLVVQAQNGGHVDDLHVRPQIVNDDRGR